MARITEHSNGPAATRHLFAIAGLACWATLAALGSGCTEDGGGDAEMTSPRPRSRVDMSNALDMGGAGLCTDTCGPTGSPGGWAGDGECDDSSVCDYGTDCSDCGPRSGRSYGDVCAEDSECPTGDCVARHCSAPCGSGQPSCESPLSLCDDDLGFCVEDSRCTPQCEGKSCGRDGCGGTCGACEGFETCSSAGACVARCDPSDTFECGDFQCRLDEVCFVPPNRPQLATCHEVDEDDQCLNCSSQLSAAPDCPMLYRPVVSRAENGGCTVSCE